MIALLAEMLPPILAAEQGPGDADKAVAPGIVTAADRGRGDRGCGAYGAADHAGRDVARPEAAAIVIAVVAVVPAAVAPVAQVLPVLVLGDLALVVAAGTGIAGSLYLAIGVWIKLGGVAGIDN